MAEVVATCRKCGVQTVYVVNLGKRGTRRVSFTCEHCQSKQNKPSKEAEKLLQRKRRR
jgi:hypothetical protein